MATKCPLFTGYTVQNLLLEKVMLQFSSWHGCTESSFLCAKGQYISAVCSSDAAMQNAHTYGWIIKHTNSYIQLLNE